MIEGTPMKQDNLEEDMNLHVEEVEGYEEETSSWVDVSVGNGGGLFDECAVSSPTNNSRRRRRIRGKDSPYYEEVIERDEEIKRQQQQEKVHHHSSCPSVIIFMMDSFLCAIPTMLFLFGFSALGYGHSSMILSRTLQQYATKSAQILGILVLTLYLFDANDWRIRYRHIAYAIVIMVVTVVVFLTQALYPVGPLCLLIFVTPLYLLGVVKKLVWYYDHHQQNALNNEYLLRMSRPLLFVGISTLIVWFIWIVSDYSLGWEEGQNGNQWDITTKIRYSEYMGCPANFQDFPQCRNEALYSETGVEDTCFNVVYKDSSMADDDRQEKYEGDIDFYSIYIDGKKSRVQFDSGCETYCTMVYNGCVHAFLVWVNPLLAGVGLLLLGFISGFLGRRNKSSSDVSYGNVDTWTLRTTTNMYLALLFVVWCTASLAGAGEGITSALLAFACSSMIAIGIFIFSVTDTSFNTHDFSAVSNTEASFQFYDVNAIHSHKSSTTKTSVFDKVSADYQPYTDAVRGLIVITLSPIIAVYLFLSFVNQSIRHTALFPCSARIDSMERFDIRDWRTWITRRTRQQVDDFNSWEDHGKIYRIAVYWGIAFTLLQVIVQQFTVVFLSWLIKKTESLPLGVATIIIFGVGIFLFLLPSTPGGPIYIAAGAVIPPAGRNSLGIVGSVAYCVLLCLIIKLVACAMQQKVIGECLSNYVTTRQWIGVNSNLVRTMQVVISGPGMNIAKSSILVGCPDWPTSVLCGVLRLNLFPILVGTVPIIFIIIPMVLTGSFAYAAALPPNDDGQMQFPRASTFSAMFAVLSAMGQFASMAAAAFYLERESKRLKDEVDRLPIDSEVQIADERVKFYDDVFTKATKWSSATVCIKWILKLSVMSMIICCYILQFWRSSCFRQFDMMNAAVEDVNIFELVSPLGWIALLFFMFSCSLLMCHLMWAKKKTEELIRRPLKVHLQHENVSGPPAVNTKDDGLHIMEPSEDLPLKYTSPSRSGNGEAKYGSLGLK